MFRIGQGYDIHRFTEGRPLILGGCEIPSPWGLAGHSDADALSHAVIDALLGALALGDIGQWFPDTDEAWLGASAKQLFEVLWADERFADWHIVNVDCTLVTQKPKLAQHIVAIRESLAVLLRCPVEAVSVKAKTKEHLDAVGAGEALEAQAVVMLAKGINQYLNP